MIGYAFSVPHGLLFLGTDCTIVEFVFIVTALEQARLCLLYGQSNKPASVHMAWEYKLYVGMVLSKHITGQPKVGLWRAKVFPSDANG